MFCTIPIALLMGVYNQFIRPGHIGEMSLIGCVLLLAVKKPSMSTGAVADAVGYQSEAAFQRAFKRHMGITPAQWRKTQQASSADLFPMRRSSKAKGSALAPMLP